MTLHTAKPVVERVDLGSTHQSRWPMLLVTIWLAMIVVALEWLSRYESTAVISGETPALWPTDVPPAGSPSGQTLIMFAHPRCPCTRASLRELGIILASQPDVSLAKVVFFRPNEADESWSHSEIVRQARALSGVEVTWDDDGRLAARFGVQTSGHVVFYDAMGTLKFSGGVTALRGHEGWNAGRAAVGALSRGEATAVAETPVFGCSLVTPPGSALDASCQVLP